MMHGPINIRYLQQLYFMVFCFLVVVLEQGQIKMIFFFCWAHANRVKYKSHI